MNIGWNRLTYLFLSFISGFVELGTVIYLIQTDQPLYLIALAGIAYQCGVLFREPFMLSLKQYFLSLVLSATLVPLIPKSNAFLLISIFFLSVGIQGMRGIASETEHISMFLKRSFRIAGFALSGLMTLNAIPYVIFSTLISTIPIVVYAKHRPITKFYFSSKISQLGMVMAIHQAHYFCYAYLIPATLITSYGITSPYSGLLFCIGWVGYLYAEKIFGLSNLVRTFLIGHALAGSALALIYFTQGYNLLLFLLLWLLTGFGGGTVYCLRKLHSLAIPDSSDLESSENIGHTIGIVICLVTLSVFKTPELSFLAAALLAAATFIAFALSQRQHSIARAQAE